MKFFSNRGTPEILWQTLSNAGLVQGEMPAAQVQDHNDLPFFVKLILGVAAWISSLLFLVFVGLLMGRWVDNAGGRAILGLIACAAAGLYFRKARPSVFVDQIFLVLILFGQILIGSAFFGSFKNFNDGARWLLMALFEIVVLVLIQYPFSRFLSALAALICLYCAALLFGVAALFMPLCLAALAAVLYYQWREPRLWPVVTLVLSLVPLFTTEPQNFYNWLGITRQPDFIIKLPFWPERIGMIAVWAGVVYMLLKQVMAAPWSSKTAVIWLLALFLAAGTWPVPLALFALAVFFLGFWQGDKTLEGVGVVQLLWALGHYYYALADTLLFKALTLSVLGAVLLLLYAGSRYLLPPAGRGQNA